MSANDSKFLLRVGPALLMIIFGIDQLLRPGDWLQYVPLWVQQMMSREDVMRLHAITNIVLGLLLLSGWNSQIIAVVAFFWFLSILPFAFMVDWKIGLRDTVITTSILASLLLKSF